MYLLTETGTAPEAYQWSVPLGAAVVVVPGNARWLSGAIADLSRRPSGSGQTICVTGGSGGVGTSTLAAGLAFVAARSGRRTALVDLDPAGAGSICWSEPNGWTGGAGRGWSRPGAIWVTSGTSCPAWTGSSCCRWAGVSRRSDRRPRPCGPCWARLTASHDLTVVDVPRHLDDDQLEPLSTAGALAAGGSRRPPRSDRRAGALSARWRRSASGPGLVVRTGRTAGCSTRRASPKGSALDLYAVLGDEPGLLQAAERGDPPGRSGRSPLGQVARRLLDEIGHSLDAARADLPE